MAADEDVNLYAPFTSDTILEVRSGRLKKYKGLNIESGIDKSLLDEPVQVGKLGINGDEHDLTFHGGPDKAVHGCKSGSQTCCFSPLSSPFSAGLLGLSRQDKGPSDYSHAFKHMSTHSTRSCTFTPRENGPADAVRPY